MSDSFNPYQVWFDIPRVDQPPNHYRLLGLELYEASKTKIEDAVTARAEFLSAISMGKHVAHAQRILNEVAMSRICLLDPVKKRDYDKKLREQVYRRTQKKSDNLRSLGDSKMATEPVVSKPKPLGEFKSSPIDRRSSVSQVPRATSFLIEGAKAKSGRAPSQKIEDKSDPAKLTRGRLLVIATVLSISLIGLGVGIYLMLGAQDPSPENIQLTGKKSSSDERYLDKVAAEFDSSLAVSPPEPKIAGSKLNTILSNKKLKPEKSLKKVGKLSPKQKLEKPDIIRVDKAFNENLVAYWPLNDGPAGSTVTEADDLVDDELHGATDGVANANGDRWVFDTERNRIVLSTTEQNRLTAGQQDIDLNKGFTWSLWAKVASSNIADRGADVLIGTRRSAGSKRLWHKIGNSGASGLVTIKNYQIADDTWHHLAYAGDSNQGVSLFIDGVLIGTDASPGAKTYNGQLEIGGSSQYTEDITALISDVAIWDKRLSEARILDLASGGSVLNNSHQSKLNPALFGNSVAKGPPGKEVNPDPNSNSDNSTVTSLSDRSKKGKSKRDRKIVLGEAFWNPGEKIQRPSQFRALQGDLLETHLLEITRDSGEEFKQPLWHNGISDNGKSYEVNRGHGENGVEIHFDTASKPGGFDIAEIRVFTAGQDNPLESAQVSQSFNLSYQLAGNSGSHENNTFIELGNVLFEPETASTTGGLLMTGTYNASGGPLMSGVSAIKLSTKNVKGASGENLNFARECIQEIDVIEYSGVMGQTISLAMPGFATFKKHFDLPDLEDEIAIKIDSLKIGSSQTLEAMLYTNSSWSTSRTGFQIRRVTADDRRWFISRQTTATDSSVDVAVLWVESEVVFFKWLPSAQLDESTNYLRNGVLEFSSSASQVHRVNLRSPVTLDALMFSGGKYTAKHRTELMWLPNGKDLEIELMPLKLGKIKTHCSPNLVSGKPARMLFDELDSEAFLWLELDGTVRQNRLSLEAELKLLVPDRRDIPRAQTFSPQLLKNNIAILDRLISQTAPRVAAIKDANQKLRMQAAIDQAKKRKGVFANYLGVLKEFSNLNIGVQIFYEVDGHRVLVAKTEPEQRTNQ